MDRFSISVHARELEARVVLSGEVDTAVAGLVRAVTEEACGLGPPRVVVDLEAVTFIDSAGVAQLVNAHKIAVQRGVELVAVASGRAERVIRMAGIAELLGLRDPATT